MRVNKFTNYLYRRRPKLLFKNNPGGLGLNYKKMDKIHNVLSSAKSIELYPLGNKKDFQLILDQKISLWFYHKTSHQFAYDKFRVGDYSVKHQSSDYANLVKKEKQKWPNAYNAWTKNEETILANEYQKGKNTKELAIILERNPGAIRSRLKKLDLV